MTWELFGRGKWGLRGGSEATTAGVHSRGTEAIWRSGSAQIESMLMMHVVMTQMNAALFGVAIFIAQAFDVAALRVSGADVDIGCLAPAAWNGGDRWRGASQHGAAQFSIRRRLAARGTCTVSWPSRSRR